MLQHYFVMILRSFKRHKSSFFINLAGLSTGLACALLIYLWIQDEVNFDKFHEKDRRIFQVMQNVPQDEGILTVENTPGLLAQALAEEMPQVEQTAVAASNAGWWSAKGILSFEDKHIPANELFVSSNYFNVFSFPLIHGNKDQVLKDKLAILLSDELAKKMFNTTEDLIGKTVEWNQRPFSGVYHIAGIFEKPPVNSSAQFDILLNYELFLEKNPHLEQWANNTPFTYVVVKEGTDIDQLNNDIKGFIKSKYAESENTLFLQRYSDKYLNGRYENGIVAGGRIEYVRLFSLIALFILAIACINFMNLSTAMASGRLKEIGVKKAMGAGRKSLIYQYLGEAIFMTFLSLIFAVVLVFLLLSPFNEIINKQLTLAFDINLILALLFIALVTGFASGSYPAIYLSGFHSVIVLKGKLNNTFGEIWTRKGLVVLQFTLSIILIVSVVVVHKQIEFTQTKSLGYDRNNIITFKKEGKLNKEFLSTLKDITGVADASSFSHNFTKNYNTTSGVKWQGKKEGKSPQFANMDVSYGLIELLGFEMAQGRAFDEKFGSEGSKIIFNEAAIKAMGLKDPIGKTVSVWDRGEKEIIGIVKDFHFESLYEEVKPCYFILASVASNIMVKIKPGTEAETIDRIRKYYQEYNMGLPFDFKFIDDNYRELYASDLRVAVLSRYFTIVAIVISCMGLFGLAAFTTERRLKEISIRKILGSSELGIIYLLSGSFTKMVLVSIVIALPISYIIAEKWLENFAYQINLAWWFFFGAGLAALLIAWLTIGMQMIKAAKTNPAQSLRNE